MYTDFNFIDIVDMIYWTSFRSNIDTKLFYLEHNAIEKS